MTTTAIGASPNRFRITVNGQEVRLEQAQVAVVELWAMLSLDPSLELVLEGVGSAPDQVLEAGAVLDLDPDNPPHLFSRPHTNFG